VLNIIRTTLFDGAIGIYFNEYEVKTAFPDNHPIMLIPAIISKRNKGDSFLLIVLKIRDFRVFI
jgi:hypothetical protein